MYLNLTFSFLLDVLDAILSYFYVTSSFLVCLDLVSTSLLSEPWLVQQLANLLPAVDLCSAPIY